MIPSKYGHDCRSMKRGNTGSRASVVGENAAGPGRVTAWLTAAVLAVVGVINQSVFASGWTEFLPSTDTRIIYVSSSQGSDSNSGLTPQDPVKSLGAGYSKLRDGYPDWLLLRRGDTWNEGFGKNVWSKSGRSETEPIRLAAYGSDSKRPRLLVSGDAFICHHNRSNVAITGIHFESASGGGDGLRIIMGYGQNWLIEDCMVEGFQNNMNLQGYGSPGEIHNLKIRRSVVVDAASKGGGHSQGIFAHNIKGLLIEECVIDRNGWSQNNNSGGSGYPTVFNHNMYITTFTTDAVVRGNIVCDASSHGVQLRCGGVLEDNVFARNPLGILFGGGDPNPDTHTHGITGRVVNNVVLEGRDLNSSNPRGFGMDLYNVGSGEVRDNIIANSMNSSQPRAITFGGTGYGSGVGVRNLDVVDNIVYNWRGTVQFAGSKIHNVKFRRNDVQVPNKDFVLEHQQSGTTGAISAANNRFHTNASSGAWVLIQGGHKSLSSWKSAVGDNSSVAEQVSYPDPNRTLGTYNAALGGSKSHTAFMAEARKQSRSNWREDYTAYEVIKYIRAGFGLN